MDALRGLNVIAPLEDDGVELTPSAEVVDEGTVATNDGTEVNNGDKALEGVEGAGLGTLIADESEARETAEEVSGFMTGMPPVDKLDGMITMVDDEEP